MSLIQLNSCIVHRCYGTMDYSHRIFGKELQPEDQALEDVYSDIIGNLIICPEHRPKGILSIPHSSIISLLNPQLMTSEYLIELVREKLNQQLSGSKEANPDIRYECASFSGSHLLLLLRANLILCVSII